jgi:ATP-dependent Clp protease protease subunit
MAASMGAVLLCAGAEENVLHCHTQVMIHQPSGGAQGVATDGNQLREMLKLKDRCIKSFPPFRTNIR